MNSSDTPSIISQNIQRVRCEIQETLTKCGRSGEKVSIVLVSKFHPQEKIIEALDAGIVEFGENRVQEAEAKFPPLFPRYPALNLHIIGRLQLNKVKKAVALSSFIDSVDSLKVLEAVEKACFQLNKKVNILLECLVGEESKAGFSSLEALKEATSLILEGKCPHITLRGLMAMAPNTPDKEAIKNSFLTVKGYKNALENSFPSLTLQTLSYGMSGDYKLALECGSNEVRLGTCIFGPREY